ncbi:dihydroorotate dehydrogenase B (NAD(+)), electron transfer subunit [Oxobacter pfennigii]|uniref:Dihydroorotate dehydrogenase B (NAD(+)), electron transfer subunit n=1 Tax=Oxobacter pfennigii TaxID=36849 RepID=A0A0P8WA71_9CLOT|nr:sulfide/dihydroorotate dehydrogenase-like FAD/NAD-binding protein [Oxobacter pfennigii]KPU44867.1 dihydroorotate dehydrogenase B (NAD(+)), electron transfer subunit [Oxobacter pfennigii]
MTYESVDCVDAGTDYCPCYLSETNDCLICSQLQGKLFCDCINWKGVCIYQEYIWNGSRRKDSRENINASVLNIFMLNEKVIFIKLKVSRTLARELNQPGSYIFIKNSNYPEFFNTPMSVMYADEINGTIDLLIQVRGIKTKIFQKTLDSFQIRGPYWNGIMGLKNLKKVSNKNCLMVVRGIAQAPSVGVAKKLKFSNNNVYVIFDEGTSNTSISKEYFDKLGCEIKEMSIMENRSISSAASAFIKETINEKDIDLIFSGGTDIIHKEIIEIKNSFSKDILLACTNNANICCGEGICGSCNTRLKDGKRIKACKAQADPEEILGGIYR